MRTVPLPSRSLNSWIALPSSVPDTTSARDKTQPETDGGFTSTPLQ
ncbi:Uncharacterised protein [Mycobacterium tuberculosis]|nr:Uncharacterised protein [Mycobacterium tuberculosis]